MHVASLCTVHVAFSALLQSVSRAFMCPKPYAMIYTVDKMLLKAPCKSKQNSARDLHAAHVHASMHGAGRVTAGVIYAMFFIRCGLGAFQRSLCAPREFMLASSLHHARRCLRRLAADGESYALKIVRYKRWSRCHRSNPCKSLYCTRPVDGACACSSAW